LDVSVLVWGVVFGSIGMGYFMYGKKQGATIPLLCGLTLMVFPYFVPDVTLLVLIGVVLSVLPYFFRGS
jgi:hypothetical protein